MGVIVKEDRLFILNTRNTSYAFFQDDDGILVQLYWGKKIERPEDYDTETMVWEQGYHPAVDKKREECTSFGMMRYKETSMKFIFPDGVRDFRYRMKEYRAEENRLDLVLEDVYYPLQVTLHYVVHEEEDILEKWREVKNTGTETVQIERFFYGEYTLPGSG